MEIGSYIELLELGSRALTVHIHKHERVQAGAHRRLTGDNAGAEPRRTRRHSGSLVLHVSWLCVGGLLVTCTAAGQFYCHQRHYCICRQRVSRHIRLAWSKPW